MSFPLFLAELAGCTLLLVTIFLALERLLETATRAHHRRAIRRLNQHRRTRH